MERVLAEQHELRAFRTYQKQPAHRARPLEEQLHGFMWNRKQKYAALLVEALDLEQSRSRSTASWRTSAAGRRGTAVGPVVASTQEAEAEDALDEVGVARASVLTPEV